MWRQDDRSPLAGSSKTLPVINARLRIHRVCLRILTSKTALEGGRKKITALFADTMELLAEPRRRDALGENHHNQNRMPFV